MNPSIEKALQYIDNDDIASYFKVMDSIDIPSNLKPIYSKHKKTFMAGEATVDFYNQLKTFANMLADSEEISMKEQKVSANPQQQGGNNSVHFNTNGGSMIAGGDIVGRDKITYEETKSSKRFKYLVIIIVPILAIISAFALYKYWENQTPLSLTLSFKNTTPNKELPFEKGKLTLQYGDKIETQDFDKLDELNFKGIPSNFKDETLQIHFEGEGFETLDTNIVFSKNTFQLSIQRDETYAKIIGTIKDEQGKPLEAVIISLQDLEVLTNHSGYFELQIPFDKQKKKQRIFIRKEGYQSQDFTTPIIAGQELRLILNKE